MRARVKCLPVGCSFDLTFREPYFLILYYGLPLHCDWRYFEENSVSQDSDPGSQLAIWYIENLILLVHFLNMLWTSLSPTCLDWRL